LGATPIQNPTGRVRRDQPAQSRAPPSPRQTPRHPPITVQAARPAHSRSTGPPSWGRGPFCAEVPPPAFECAFWLIYITFCHHRNPNGITSRAQKVFAKRPFPVRSGFLPLRPYIPEWFRDLGVRKAVYVAQAQPLAAAGLQCVPAPLTKAFFARGALQAAPLRFRSGRRVRHIPRAGTRPRCADGRCTGWPSRGINHVSPSGLAVAPVQVRSFHRQQRGLGHVFGLCRVAQHTKKERRPKIARSQLLLNQTRSAAASPPT